MIIDEEEQKQMIANTLRNSQPINNQARSLKYGLGNQNLPKPKNKFFTNALRFGTQLGSDFLLGSSTAEALGYRPDVMKGQGYTPSYRDQFNTTVDLLRQGKTTEGLVKGAETLLTGTGTVGEGLMLGSAVAGPLAPLLLGAGFVVKGLSKGGKLILQSKTGKQILANFTGDKTQGFNVTDIELPKNDTSPEIQTLEDNIDIPTTKTEVNDFEPINNTNNIFVPEPELISARLPTAVNSNEDGINNILNVGLAESKILKPQFDANVKIISEYPNLKLNEITNKTTDEIADTYVNHLKNNLLYLHDKVPENTRKRSKKWYDGANKVSNTWSKEFNIPTSSVAGTIAALSPQKDWYMNASLAYRVLDINKNKQDFIFDKKMMSKAKELYGKPVFKEMLKNIDGKKLSELDSLDAKAIWTRVYDETYNDKSFKVLTPEGEFGDFVKTDKGENADIAWGSNHMIKSALLSMDSGGDAKKITNHLGDRHKVRSFYNNIISPNSKNGDVTIDTHAVAAATLQPVSGNSTTVYHNFGTSPLLRKRQKDWQGATKNSSISGNKGTYGIYAEAYRKAAKERNILPREMQSITWEAIRGLFTSGYKQNKQNVENISKLWYDYRNDKLTLQEVLDEIEKRAGGINPPSWE